MFDSWYEDLKHQIREEVKAELNSVPTVISETQRWAEVKTEPIKFEAIPYSERLEILAKLMKENAKKYYHLNSVKYPVLFDVTFHSTGEEVLPGNPVYTYEEHAKNGNLIEIRFYWDPIPIKEYAKVRDCKSEKELNAFAAANCSRFKMNYTVLRRAKDKVPIDPEPSVFKTKEHEKHKEKSKQRLSL